MALWIIVIILLAVFFPGVLLIGGGVGVYLVVLTVIGSIVYFIYSEIKAKNKIKEKKKEKKKEMEQAKLNLEELEKTDTIEYQKEIILNDVNRFFYVDSMDELSDLRLTREWFDVEDKLNHELIRVNEWIEEIKSKEDYDPLSYKVQYQIKRISRNINTYKAMLEVLEEEIEKRKKNITLEEFENINTVEHIKEFILANIDNYVITNIEEKSDKFLTGKVKALSELSVENVIRRDKEIEDIKSKSGCDILSKEQEYSIKYRYQFINEYRALIEICQEELNRRKPKIENSNQGKSKAQELKEFKELLDSEIITQEEFDKKKAELLK